MDASTNSDTNSDSDIRTRWIELPSAAGAIDAYVALPPAAQDGGKAPGLLLLQEIFGVNPHIRSVARQYALAGFTVLAPDLFWRQERRVQLGYVGPERDRALQMMRALKADEVQADLMASAAALRALPECGPRIGAIGYCMGGRLAYATAALGAVDAAVSYYGGGIATQLDLAARIQVPMLFHHAGHDASIPPEAVAKVREAMAASPAAAETEFFDYPDSQHGFNCWARAAYDPGAAALALGRSLVFLSRLF